jgi:hypothetical protein
LLFQATFDPSGPRLHVVFCFQRMDWATCRVMIGAAFPLMKRSVSYWRQNSNVSPNYKNAMRFNYFILFSKFLFHFMIKLQQIISHSSLIQIEWEFLH